MDIYQLCYVKISTIMRYLEENLQKLPAKEVRKRLKEVIRLGRRMA